MLTMDNTKANDDTKYQAESIQVLSHPVSQKFIWFSVSLVLPTIFF
jgi:hypothetical protein